jgi:hypothetical protein
MSSGSDGAKELQPRVPVGIVQVDNQYQAAQALKLQFTVYREADTALVASPRAVHTQCCC